MALAREKRFNLRDHLAAFFIAGVYAVGAYGFLGGFGLMRAMVLLGGFFLVFTEYSLRIPRKIPKARMGYFLIWLVLLTMVIGNSLRTTIADLNRNDMIYIMLSVMGVFNAFYLMTAKRAELVLWYGACMCAPAAIWIVKSTVGGDMSGAAATFILGDNYLGPAHAGGFGVLCAFSLFMFRPNTRSITFPLTLILASGLAFSIARGALLSTVLLCGVVAIFGIINALWDPEQAILGRADAAKAMVITFMTGVGMIVQAFMLQKTRDRILSLLENGAEAGGQRTIFWANAFRAIEKNGIIGYGTSNYPWHAGRNWVTYPHNIFLGYWLDAGLFGLLIISVILFAPFFYAYLAWRRLNQLRWLLLAWTTLFLFGFLEWIKSFNFYGIMSIAISAMMVVVMSTLADERAEEEAALSLQPA